MRRKGSVPDEAAPSCTEAARVSYGDQHARIARSCWAPLGAAGRGGACSSTRLNDPCVGTAGALVRNVAAWLSPACELASPSACALRRRIGRRAVLTLHRIPLARSPGGAWAGSGLRLVERTRQAKEACVAPPDRRRALRTWVDRGALRARNAQDTRPRFRLQACVGHRVESAIQRENAARRWPASSPAPNTPSAHRLGRSAAA
jgi:hypothetical protein